MRKVLEFKDLIKFNAFSIRSIDFPVLLEMIFTTNPVMIEIQANIIADTY